jgi:hypothetical protein
MWKEVCYKVQSKHLFGIQTNEENLSPVLSRSANYKSTILGGGGGGGGRNEVSWLAQHVAV